MDNSRIWWVDKDEPGVIEIFGSYALEAKNFLD